MKKPTKKNIGWIAVVVLIIIQFFQIDKSQAPIDESKDYLVLTQAPAPIAKMIKNACYDCHSDQTVWPWYASIQPIGWWVRGHTRGARQHLNFSDWATYGKSKQAHKLEECVEQVQEKLMPLKSYGWMHPDGQLSDADRVLLVDWFSKIE